MSVLSSIPDAVIKEIETLNNRAWELNRENPSEAIALANKALAKSTEVNYTTGIALAKKTIGACLIWTSKNDEGMEYCMQANDLFKQLKDKKNGSGVYVTLGTNFYFMADYDAAIKCYRTGYDLSSKIDYEPGMADALNGIGTVYYTLNQNEKALEALLKSEKLCKKHNVNSTLVKVQNGLGETYHNLSDYEKALFYYNCSIDLCRSTKGLQTVEAYSLDGVGRTYIELKAYDTAQDYYQKSLSIRKQLGFKIGEATTLGHLGVLYAKKNETETAIKFLLEAYSLASSINSKEAIYQTSEKLAAIYEAQGNVAEALKYFKVFHQAKEEVKNFKSLQLTKSFELQNRVLQTAAEKAILEERAKEAENFSDNLTLMSKIGQQIISSLSVEAIVKKAYESVNGLMDATGFGIGLHHKESNTLVFPVYIEGEETFENVTYESTDSDRLAVQCFIKEKEIIINDYYAEIQNNTKQVFQPKAGKNVESLIYLPLKYKDTVLGVITVQSFSKQAYSNYHVNILKNLATYTAIALENAKLYGNLEQKVEERTDQLLKSKEEIERSYLVNKKINEIGRKITSNLNLKKIFRELYDNLNEIMLVECFGVRIYRPETNSVDYKFEIERGVLDEEVHNIPLTDENNYTVWCIKNKKDIFLNDNKKEYSKYVKEIRVVTGDMPNSLLFTPMLVGEKLVGVITVQSFEYSAYEPRHLDILKTLSIYTAIALENASLYENMEEKVKERTAEVVKKKEEIEQTFENARTVSEIGQEISSTFSTQEIIKKVYNRVNKLMDATMFGIGIYDPAKEEIKFSGVIEKGETLADYAYGLSKIDRPAIWCFTKQSDYVIQNFTEEFVKSNKIKDFNPVAGDTTESIIYVPLTHQNKRIGVITVQSYKANAYSDYHLQMLKSLALYTAIALDNASLYSNMEERVKERTAEIEKNYNDTRLLSQIAEDISASLSVETITSTLYVNVNKLMKATMFGIGLYNPDNNKLEFRGFVENNVVMPDFSYLANDPNRLAAFCFQNEQEIHINDYSKEYKKYIQGMKPPVSGKDSTSIVYIPLYAKGKIIGVFTVQSFEKDIYSEYQFNILKNLAVSIGIALDNANLYQHLEEKVKERTLEVIKQKEQIEKTFDDTRTMTKIGNDITSTLSAEEIVDKVFAKITSLMEVHCFGVGLYSKETKKIFYPLFIEGEERFSSMAYDITEKDKLTYLCYNHNRDIVINDFKNEIVSLVGEVKHNYVGGLDTQSVIYLPMMLKEKVIGVITVQSLHKNAYTDYHVQILKNLAVYVAIAIDNALLYQNMESMVAERTTEVTKQKELIEKNFNDVKLSAQIAKDIASSLSVETIVSKVYENVRTIVNAESFGIGLYNAERNTMQFSGFIEKGEKLPFVEVSMNDKERYAVMCFENEIEIIINDHQKEYIKYTKELKKSIVGELPDSLVYLPLYTKEKKIGVLTAQCFTKNSFQDFQVNILKNMALSIAIALDNANLYQNLEAKVEERTAEVNKQKAIIEEKNKDITDSIRYAKKIQQAIAPNIEEFNRNFTDSFILYKPKDIVSGDFYWFDHFDNATTVFAAADCTGHGVPGAFMSLICSDIMYKVINDKKIQEPGQALMAIDERLVKLIKKSSESSANDGMDIALCAYHKNEKKILYAGAHRPLLLIRNGEIIEYRPSKFSIGGHSTDGKQFDQYSVDVLPGDVFYLLTDGYADQFGGEKGKKFKFKNFKDLVLSVSHMPMKEQRKLLDEAFEAWKGTLEQIDDVCVMGVRI